jgi:hypothetical protein
MNVLMFLDVLFYKSKAGEAPLPQEVTFLWVVDLTEGPGTMQDSK